MEKKTKRGKLEIMRDILKIIRENKNLIKTTPLLRKSNLSSLRFQEYFSELKEKGFIRETEDKTGRSVSLTDKGFRFLERYQAIISFIDEFEL
ncbi:MAG: winged helix-turn-helix transcriptional regulator [Candidatus Pacearchaeota archaeon]|nr:winged helix-turn-helix transcriptional regulator [Candidatus Pacearchaeota archaeon]